MSKQELFGLIGKTWGVFGVLALLIFAIYRLSAVALEALGMELSWIHYTLLVINVLFMAYSEGFRGFHQSYSPRIVTRAQYLQIYPSLIRVLLAPVFCMGLFHAKRRLLISSWVLLISIVILIILIRFIAQPWRGILDAGVVVGLTLGSVSILYFYFCNLAGRDIRSSPDTP